MSASISILTSHVFPDQVDSTKRERENHGEALDGQGLAQRRRTQDEEGTAIEPVDMLTVGENRGEECTVVDLITKILWSDDQTVIKEALTKLANSCKSTKSVCPSQARASSDEIHKAGGHVAIIGVMKKFNESTSILEEGMRVLQNACSKSDGIRVATGDIGGVTLIVDIMKEFKDNRNVQRNGCGALHNLVLHNSRNAEQLVQCGGILVVLDSMKEFPDNAMLHFLACGILSYLSTVRWGDEVKDAGAEKIAAGTLFNHYDNEKTRRSARRLLKILF